MIRRAILSLSLVLWLILAMVPGAQAGAGTPEPRVLPPQSSAYGSTYGEWSAKWWQWALSIPASTNPLFDQTGARCTQGQSGKVFFLAGLTAYGGAVTRECAVPAGRALFFPLLNGVDVHVEGLDQMNAQQLRAELLGWEGLPSELHVSVDGVAVTDLGPSTTPYHVCAGGDSTMCASAFSVALPDGNLFGIAEGVYGPAVDDGYYVMLAPLPPGTHTVRFGGRWAFGGYDITQDITYVLTVK